MTERDEASTPTRVGLSEGLGPVPKREELGEQRWIAIPQ